MALQKYIPSSNLPSARMKPLSFTIKVRENAKLADPGMRRSVEADVDVDLREVYFLIMHFLSTSPCQRTCGQLLDELLEHQLLPRRYHACYSRNRACSGDENDDGTSFPLNYAQLVERYPHIEKDHLVKLLKQLMLSSTSPSRDINGRGAPNAADVPTLLGTGSFSLLSYDSYKGEKEVKHPPAHMRWPHVHADQVRGLALREIGGGFARHHRAPSIRGACYVIAKPSTMVQKMQNIKRLRGHRNAVYCAIFDQSGRYVITGSDDRLVKIWSMETAYCLASCRGHEGDITDLAVSSNNVLVASSSNDCVIRVWRLPDGLPISVLRGHNGAVTAIAFSPRPSSIYQLLSSSDDGTCRLWDARNAQVAPRIYVPRPSDSAAGRNSGPSSSNSQQSHQIFCCAFNASGTVFVTGSSDTLARVWNACRSNLEDPEKPNHEIDVLSGHENDVNYVQFSGCAAASRLSTTEISKEENVPKFRNSWFTHDNIVTCSRDGSAIIWIPRSRKSHGKVGRWTRAYHLKVPPPPMPPQPPQGGPRQRILPTPRGVNMIVWSLDNRFVLAAIMDCRICVWNAADGSLVHSLTGHTESTYVLDVHPFNPRIAMSAGYDGRTIVWDIWEGKPIWIYPISHFKLVDGKFSPDGTSIILSDDVGQLYVLNTGQGEAQQDAKYDQFFLGDYRPLMQDTHGNVVDQETQLAPYRRNIQDLLCDSGMIPYEEPYQTMYQKRRLGALGLEWHPSSSKLAVGPDITLDQEYQMLPLADLDGMVDPLPEFMDVMDWEPEIEVLSDDNDSEYNVTEEFSAGVDQGIISSSSGESECSAEDSEMEDNDNDVRRRSKRKKLKSEVEIMTSSGRRVKRRNLDECDGNSSRNKHNKKSRNSRKASHKKSSSKSLRPQRAAARNALTLFSKITGTSSDGEDEDGSISGSSESESMIHDSNIESDESGRSLQNEAKKHSKGKEVSLDVSEDVIKIHETPESHNARKRLVLKLPARHSNKSVTLESRILRKVEKLDNLASAGSQDETEGSIRHTRSFDPGCSSQEMNSSIISRGARGLSDKIADHLHLLEGFVDGTVKWGGAKARSSKRLRLGDAMSSDAHTGSRERLNDPKEIKNNDGYIKSEKAADIVSEVSNGFANVEMQSIFSECKDHQESLKWANISSEDTTAAATHYHNGIDQPPELKECNTPVSMKLRITSKCISTNSEISEVKIRCSQENHVNDECDSLHHFSSELKENPISEVPKFDETSGFGSDHGSHRLHEPGAQVDRAPASTLNDAGQSHMQSKKMYDVVYTRSKLHRDKTNSEHEGGMEGSPQNNCNLGMTTVAEVHEGTPDGARRTRSSKFKSANVLKSEETYGSAPSSSFGGRQLPSKESESSSMMTVGLRSIRNRRSNYSSCDVSPIKKSHRSDRKGSWLMLTVHEEGFHYIPQQGDEIVYLRQGHEEYLTHNRPRLREQGPWTTLEGKKVRAVELCKVEDLQYSTFPGSGESCCKLTLRFTNPTSNVFDESFKLTLSEVTSLPDFLVERTRFDAAITRNWSCRDKCKVWWWKNEDGNDGNWWDGRVVSVKPKCSEFPDSPWERYAIQYRDNPRETHNHSPWELFDADTQLEQRQIDSNSRDQLLSEFVKLEQSGRKVQDKYGVNKLNQISEKSTFTNRVPVPLSPEIIKSRLENNYYRSLEAFKHDFQVMLKNAEDFQVIQSVKVKSLSEWLRRTLSSLESP
ncbi:hypothetical protein SLEP1_g19 [Rubroshorea leprosula]|uniref:Uncharacterized protein n=1 Tax=Rubroshorea leprosula TaxID=152421 RepID=A0AAV5HHE3_9ROSI|nr:hypothetical protein SLEP1_g19 [Rubroshorea leprosula]